MFRYLSIHPVETLDVAVKRNLLGIIDIYVLRKFKPQNYTPGSGFRKHLKGLGWWIR